MGGGDIWNNRSKPNPHSIALTRPRQVSIQSDSSSDSVSSGDYSEDVTAVSVTQKPTPKKFQSKLSQESAKKTTVTPIVKKIKEKPRSSLEVKLPELKARAARLKAEREKMFNQHQQHIDSFHGKIFEAHENKQAVIARLNSLEHNVNRERSQISSRKQLEQRQREKRDEENREKFAGVRGFSYKSGRKRTLGPEKRTPAVPKKACPGPRNAIAM